MAGYKLRYKPKRRLKWIGLLALAILIVAAALGGWWVDRVYKNDLLPVSNNQTTKIFTVKSGTSLKQIASDLESQHLIRSAWAMELYVHGKKLSSNLEAGSYAFSPSQGTEKIVAILSRGRVSTELVTILPGRRIDQVRADLINYGFSPADVDQALQPSQYAGLPIMSIVPSGTTTLEGLLWPDSYQKDATTSASYIVRESLQAMDKHLTADLRNAFAAENLSPYQGLTLASIIVQEVNNPSDQAQAAQVFMTRLNKGMMLGSDVTANYGAIAAGKAPDLSYDSPYNTLIHTGLPPTPISSVSESSLQAAAHPAGTNWLYFVTGDNGTTYFSQTLQEHQALTQKYCHKLCSQ